MPLGVVWHNSAWSEPVVSEESIQGPPGLGGCLVIPAGTPCAPPPREEAEEGAVLGRGAAVGIVLCKMGTAGAACPPGGRSEFLL